MKKWPKEDKYSWEKSEVMREFESKILSNYSFLEKYAMKPAEVKALGDQVKALKSEFSAANTAAKELNRTLTGAADDGSMNHKCDSAEDCAICQGGMSDDSEYTDDEMKLAKAEILRELQKMADDAILDRNIKLAYRIERTISEVEEG
jgi:hypothetical protein